MKTICILILCVVVSNPKSLIGQNYPSIGAHTVIPAFYGPVLVPTKFVTATTILNQGLHLGTSFTVTPPGVSWLGKIELRGCYFDGQLLPATQTFIDTFHVGILQGGDTYTVTFRAYLSSSSTSCIPVDSNQISFFHTIPIVESLSEWDYSRKLMVYPNPASETLHILCEDPEAAYILITDTEGRSIEKKVIELEHTEICLEHFSNGFYIYTIYDAQERPIFTGKFVLTASF